MTFKRLLTLAGLKQFFTILSQKEKIFFSIFIFLGIASLAFLCVNFYLENTKIVPAKGGTHIEGVIGSPRFINPVFAPYSDIDRDLTKLVFSGLMKYGKNNKIIPDLAERYEILEYGRVFEFHLRENLIWSDGKPLTADDVVFTIKAIQNPAIDSLLRAKWLGVEVEKISDLKIRFELKNPSAIFLENTIIGIIPKHIWQNVPEKIFRLSIHNLQPTGSGPYKIKDIIQDKQGKIESIELTFNPNYHGKIPYISNIIFSFFETKRELVQALQGEETLFPLPRFANARVTGFFVSAPIKEETIPRREFSKYRFLMPRYFTVFFNPEKSEILAQDKIRRALNYGTNRQVIISEVIFEEAEIVISPILPEIFGLEGLSKPVFDQKQANKLLDQTGFLKKNQGIREKVIDKIPAFQFTLNLRRGDRGREVRELQRCLADLPEIYPHGVISGYFGDKTRDAVIRFQEKYRETILDPQNLARGTGVVKIGTRAKLNKLCHRPTKETTPLKFSLSTVNQPFLIKIAEHLKKQWGEIGIELEIKTFTLLELEEKVIRPRNYQMLLFGQSLRAIPDPFPFWHSTQKRDPGLNLALYENRRADELLEKIRQTLDEQKRKKALEEFQKILIRDNPAIFLFNPAFLYFVCEEIKGISEKVIIDPSKRFSNIENWYIRERRIFK